MFTFTALSRRAEFVSLPLTLECHSSLALLSSLKEPIHHSECSSQSRYARRRCRLAGLLVRRRRRRGAACLLAKSLRRLQTLSSPSSVASLGLAWPGRRRQV